MWLRETKAETETTACVKVRPPRRGVRPRVTQEPATGCDALEGGTHLEVAERGAADLAAWEGEKGEHGGWARRLVVSKSAGV